VGSAAEDQRAGERAERGTDRDLRSHAARLPCPQRGGRENASQLEKSPGGKYGRDAGQGKGDSHYSAAVGGKPEQPGGYRRRSRDERRSEVVGAPIQRRQSEPEHRDGDARGPRACQCVIGPALANVMSR